MELQLARMLESKRVQGAPNRHMLLEYVVRKCLANEEISEQIIGRKLFPNYAKDTSDDVRATATNLRETLTKYYAEDGAADPIVISLPRGPGYRPVFSYNSPAAAPCALGLHLYAAMTRLSDISTAVGRVDHAIALDPTYAPAHAARAEIVLGAAAFGRSRETKERVAMAEASAGEALRLSAGLWRPHVVLGIVHSCRRVWDKAEASFKAALKASPEETERHSWYAAYLLATGRKRKALRLLELRADNEPGDLRTLSVHAMFLYAACDFKRAEALLREVRYAYQGLTQVALACIMHGLGDKEAWVHLEAAHKSLSGIPFPGLYVLFLSGGDTEAQRKAEELAREWLPDLKLLPLQLALCRLALGKPQQAIAALRRARGEHDPLMIWAHLWPFLDPLREHAAFRQLIEEMNFPSKR